MNRYITISLLLPLLLTGCRNNTAEISGILENPLPKQYIFLQELMSNKLHNIDSAIISENGSFDFKWNVNIPSFYLLKINQNNFLTMLVGPGEKIKITSDFDSLNSPIAVIGSEGTSLMADFNRHVQKTRNKISRLSEIHDKNLGRADFANVVDSLDNIGHIYLNELNNYAKNYIDKNISSLVSLFAIYTQIAPGVYVINPENDFQYYLKVDSSLTVKYPDYGPVTDFHNQVKEMAAYYENKKAASAATEDKSEAPEIALPSPEGDTIRLSSTRGSYVLLDFWASWCAPCRMENPNLVRAYSLYHNRGFQIFQVSLDKTREAWIKGIQDDKLDKWIHVSDVKYWQSSVVQLYKIESIPSNLLLDKDGKILARNLRGDALQKKLASIFR